MTAPLTCSATLLELGASADRVAQASRQLARADAANRAVVAETARLGHTSGQLPPSLRDLLYDFSDAMSFAVVAARSAARVANVLRGKVEGLHEMQQVRALNAARDLDQHWDVWQPVEPSSEGPPSWASMRAGQRWMKHSDGPPGSNYSYDEEGGLTDWSGIDLRLLRYDLATLGRQLDTLRDRVYEHHYPREAEAIKIVGDEALFRFLRLHRGLSGFRVDDQLRFRRQDLESALAHTPRLPNYPFKR